MPVKFKTLWFSLIFDWSLQKISLWCIRFFKKNSYYKWWQEKANYLTLNPFFKIFGFIEFQETLFYYAARFLDQPLRNTNKWFLSSGDVSILWRHFSFVTSFSIRSCLKTCWSVLTMGRSFNFTYLFACVILFAVYAAPLEKENVDGQQLPSYGKWNVWISRWDRLR